MNADLHSLGSSDAGDSQGTSLTLIERAKGGEEAAWDRMAELYGPMVYVWCRQFGLRAEDAADIVQDVFAAIAGAIVSFRGGRAGAFRSWLRAIMRNKINDMFRRQDGQLPAEGGSSALRRLMQRPQPAAPGKEGSTDGNDDRDDDEVRRYVVDMVRAEFSDHIWRAFWRVAVDAQSPRDVAEELEMSVSAVYQAKSRVLRRLREGFRDLELRA